MFYKYDLLRLKKTEATNRIRILQLGYFPPIVGL